MPNYKYRGVDRIGKSITGIITASDERALESILAETGSVLIEILPFEDKTSHKNSGGISIFKPKVKDGEIIEFFTTLRSLIKAGVSLLDTMTTVSKEIDNLYFQSAIEDVISKVHGGTPFGDALENHPRIFSTYVVGMVKAGEMGGNLPETFEELVRYMEWQTALKNNIKQATIYPATIICALFGFIAILFTFVVPRFMVLLSGLNIPLPLPTRVIMMLSHFCVTTWWIWMILGVVGFIVFRYSKKHIPKVAFAIDKFKLKIVLFGEINRMITVSRFAHNFAVLFKSGVPIINNLELCMQLVGNKVMENALHDARNDISGGLPLNESLRKHDLFTSKEMLMITVGETSGNLGESLGNIANHYNDEVPRRVKRIFSIMEPVITLSLIGVVGMTATAIFLPILSMFGGKGMR